MTEKYLLVGFLIVLVITAGLSAYAKRIRKKKKTENAPMAFGCICGLAGTYEGKEFSIHSGDEIRIGKNMRDNDLVIDGGHIGEKHCVIIYDKSSKKYCIKNVSETEIRLNSDIHLQKGEEACLEDGTVIYLGETRHMFRLGEKNCG